MKWTRVLIWMFIIASTSCAEETEDDSKIEIIEDVFPQAQLETENGTQLETITYVPVIEASYEEYIPLDVKSGEYPFYDENPTTEKSRMRKGKKTRKPRGPGLSRYQRILAHKEMLAKRKGLKKAVKNSEKTGQKTNPYPEGLPPEGLII